jgi:hypothetical protein
MGGGAVVEGGTVVVVVVVVLGAVVAGAVVGAAAILAEGATLKISSFPPLSVEKYRAPSGPCTATRRRPWPDRNGDEVAIPPEPLKTMTRACASFKNATSTGRALGARALLHGRNCW